MRGLFGKKDIQETPLLNGYKVGFMVYRKKGRFVLDIEHLQEIVDDILKRPKHSDVTIVIDKSPCKGSKSLYLKIFIDDYTTCLRISDHTCKGQIRNIIVTENTGNANIYYKIESAIRDLRYKRSLGVIGAL